MIFTRFMKTGEEIGAILSRISPGGGEIAGYPGRQTLRDSILAEWRAAAEKTSAAVAGAALSVALLRRQALQEPGEWMGPELGNLGVFLGTTVWNLSDMISRNTFFCVICFSFYLRQLSHRSDAFWSGN